MDILQRQERFEKLNQDNRPSHVAANGLVAPKSVIVGRPDNLILLNQLCHSRSVTRLCYSRDVTQLCHSRSVTQLCYSRDVTQLCHDRGVTHLNFVSVANCFLRRPEDPMQWDRLYDFVYCYLYLSP